MTNSRRLAGLLGPTLIAVAVSEWMNLPLMLSNPAPVVLIYLNGTLLFVAGLSIVRTHKRWKVGWPVLVTLTGWLAIVGGLFRMFAPAFAQQHEQNTTAIRVLLIVLLAVGSFLTFKAYGRASEAAVP
jgi:cation transport ATPase